MKQKKPSVLSRVLRYGGNCRSLAYLAWLLSGISAVLALVPFVELFYIIRDVIRVSPDYGQATEIVRHGWLAVGFALLSMLVYRYTISSKSSLIWLPPEGRQALV